MFIIKEIKIGQYWLKLWQGNCGKYWQGGNLAAGQYSLIYIYIYNYDAK